MKSTSPNARRDTSLRNTLLAAVGLIVAAALLISGLFLASDGSAGKSADPAAASSGAAPSDLARRTPGDPTAMGSEDAPVVMIEYADLRCPFCGVFARDTLPQLEQKYVETGVLRIEWRDLPVFGEDSFQGALAARAAGEQGKFWEFTKAAYDIAPERGHASLTTEKLRELAEVAGVPDLEKFDADIKSAEFKSAVEEDAREASSIGATGTPTFLINGSPLVGAQPMAVFEKEIDAALQAAKSK